MRTRLLLCLAAALTSSCVKRINPDPGEQRTTLSGLYLRFGEKQEVPEGTRILWDFGDGTPQQEGAAVTHAFPRAGVYTVVETILDKDGKSRTARTHVTALKRTVPMAVPAEIRAALMMPSPWARVAVHREVAAKLSLGSFFDEAARTLSEGAGFDVLDPKAADANGFDPDEGIAVFTVPHDPEALIFAIGTNDDGKSLGAAKRLLTSSRSVGHYGGGAFQLRDGQLADGTPIVVGQNAAGDKVGVLQRAGYLYLRLAGATDPALALRDVAAANPEKGLTADAGFNTAARHVGIGDALFFSRRADAGGEGRLSGELGLSAFSIYAKPENHDFVQARIFSQLKTLSGDQLIAAFKPLMAPPDLASRLPAGAAAYLRLSAAPAALWRELTRTAGADAQRMRDRVQETTGLDLEKDLIPSFSGNVGVGVYLDATSLIEAILGEQVGSFDRSVFVAAAQLKDEQTVKAALDRAMTSRPVTDRAIANGGSWYRLGDGVQAAIKEGVFYLALGGSGPAEEAPPPKGKKRKAPPKKKAPTIEDMGILGRILFPPSQTLGQEFKRIGVQGFEVPGQENFWVDIAGIVRSIDRAGGEQGGVVGQGTRLFAQRAEGLRDALFEARPGKDGIDADLWLRFLPQKKSAGR